MFITENYSSKLTIVFIWAPAPKSLTESSISKKSLDMSLRWLVDFNAGKTQLISFEWSNNVGAIDVKMDASVLG